MDLLLQLLGNGLYAAGWFALLGMSFGLIYATTRIFHIAHGVAYASGAYFLVLAYQHAGLPLLPSAVIAVTGSGALGLAFELLLYRPLRSRGASGFVMFVASLGALTVLTAVITMVFGPALIVLQGMPQLVIRFGPVLLTALQLVAMTVSAIAALLFVAYWRWTWGGRALRAVTSNPMRARVAGISPDALYLHAMVLGSAIAGIAGVLAALNEGGQPEMILTGALVATAAMLVGGIGSVGGAALGGVVLALVMNLGIWKIAGQWEYAIAFGVLLVFIIFRPRGLLGEKTHKAEI